MMATTAITEVGQCDTSPATCSLRPQRRRYHGYRGLWSGRRLSVQLTALAILAIVAAIYSVFDKSPSFSGNKLVSAPSQTVKQVSGTALRAWTSICAPRRPLQLSANGDDTVFQRNYHR